METRDKKKRFITYIILISMVLNIIAPSISIGATPLEIEYKDFIAKLEDDTGKVWNRPRPVITATLPDGTKTSADGSENPMGTTGSPWYQHPNDIENPHITVPIGTKIDLDSSLSTVGSGTALTGYDWQVYSQVNPNGTYNKPPVLTTGKSTSFTPTEEGRYSVYLNVRDNYILSTKKNSNIGFPNWGDGGNYRAIYAPGQGKAIKSLDLTIMDWYFTVLTVDVTGAVDLQTASLTAMPETVTGKDVTIIHNL